MSARTDDFPVNGTEEERERMKTASQERPSVAREALIHGLLVFGLCPDMKWRRVQSIKVTKLGPKAPTVFMIVFVSGYVRQFNKNGALLVEVPPQEEPS